MGKEKSGSSRKAILKYIVANYKVGDAAKAQNRVRLAVKRMAAKKALVPGRAKGKGAGKFKLAEKPKKAKKPKKKKAPKKKPAKKVKKLRSLLLRRLRSLLPRKLRSQQRKLLPRRRLLQRSQLQRNLPRRLQRRPHQRRNRHYFLVTPLLEVQNIRKIAHNSRVSVVCIHRHINLESPFSYSSSI